MRRTGLNFAPGTTDDCKRLVGRLVQPAALLDAYRTACATSGTPDIVLFMSDQSPEIHGGARMTYCAHLKNVFGDRAPEFKMWRYSAQAHMKLPHDAEAMWLVVDIRGVDLPVMCVIEAVPYSVTPELIV